MSALAQAAAIERGVGLLPLQIRRHQEELRRWRQLENHSPPPAYPRSGGNSGTGGSSGTRNVAAVQRARAVSSAQRVPRQESRELQALVIERRELLARQKSQSRPQP